MGERVHYRSPRGDLRFDCYARHLADNPPPKHTSNLRFVSCKECWFNIEQMAVKLRGRKFKVVTTKA